MDALSAAAAWRSPDLGAPTSVVTSAGNIEAFVRGSGPTVVLVHGWLANANLWRKVVAALADRRRCVSVDLPLGSHRRGVGADADLSPSGMGRIICEVLAALDLRDAILVGNDSGGAYSQAALSQDASRAAGLVLNACETPYDPFPPPAFDGLQAAARSPGALRAAMSALKEQAPRNRAYGAVAKRPIDRDAGDSYVLPILEDDRILSDAEKAFGAANQAAIAAAGAVLTRSFKQPVRLAWAADDIHFPLANARRYAGEFSDGALTIIEDSQAFTPEDNPNALAELIAALRGPA